MIKIKKLTKRFAAVPVLNDINLGIGAGKIYGLIGRSGAGKSTLLRCINGLECYETGSLMVDGVDVKSLSHKAAREFKREIGMIFQQFSLLSRLTVYDNIALPMKCWKFKKRHIDRKVKELVGLVGISDKLYAMPDQLSGGQKQRVAIARALSMDPKILLCDEATSSLDPNTAKSIIALLIKINRQLNITIVVVTHQMSVVRDSCEKISILENGTIVESGPVEEIFMRQSKALGNIIGDNDLILPKEGVNIKILMGKDIYTHPLITKMSRALETDFIILGGETERYRKGVFGSVIINVPENAFINIANYLDETKIRWMLIDSAEYATKNAGEEKGDV